MTNLIPNIGKEIRRIRTEMKISLDIAAHLTGVSKSMLGQIERGESNPTLSTLWKISNGFKVTLSNFVSCELKKNSVVHLHELNPIDENGGNMMVYNIFPFDPISGFDYLHIVINPHYFHESLPHANVLNEYIIVVEGCLQIIVNDEAFLLEKGSSMSFPGGSKHTYGNQTDEKVIFQNIIRYI